MNSLAWFTRCHVSHGITDFVSRLAIVRMSGRHPVIDGATAAPFRHIINIFKSVLAR
jgi:hypothetical protein